MFAYSHVNTHLGNLFQIVERGGQMVGSELNCTPGKRGDSKLNFCPELYYLNALNRLTSRPIRACVLSWLFYKRCYQLCSSLVFGS